MANLTECMQCCGLDELSGIQYDTSPRETINEVISSWYCEDGIDECDYDDDGDNDGQEGIFPGRAHIIFSDANDNPKKPEYGKKLADYIREHRLGRVIRTRKKRNPNSGNDVICYVWTPNTDNCFTYYKKVLKNGK